MSIRESRAERAMNHAFVVILILLSALMLFPFINLLAKSVSGEAGVLTGSVYLLPKDFQLGTYEYVVNQPQFFNSFWNSLFITVVGTALAMVVNCLTAYPLSKTWIVGRKGLILFFVFTMLFSGGMVPSYLLMRTLNLINNIWVLILPGILSVYNMILLKNFFEEIPESIEESAQLDGARNLTILIRIVLPMSLPAIATIGLFYAVGFWNNYMSGIMYITRPQLKPLQQYLYEVVTEAQTVSEDAVAGYVNMDRMMNASLITESIRAATIMLSSIPIMLVYPFLQKYFVAGLRVGSVKG